MRHLKLTCIALILLLLDGLAFGQDEDFGPAVVVVEQAQMAKLAPQVDVPGTVVSRNDARLASEVSARLVWIADVGTKVSYGEPVARFDNITFKLQEAQARSEVAREQARVVFLKSELKRLEELAKQNNAAKSRLDQTVSDLAVAQSDVAVAEARLGLAQVALAVTEIKAPFDGIVTEKLSNVGERLNIADEVVRLVDPTDIEIVARAPLNTVNFVQVDDHLPAHNDFREGVGTVSTIVPFGNPQSHMFEVRLQVDPEVWTVGESVRLAMPTARAKEVLAVPRDALVLRREGVSVVRVSSDNTAEQVPVVTGLGDGRLIQVIGNLKTGDRVVVRGAERLSPGDKVSVSSNSDPQSAQTN